MSHEYYYTSVPRGLLPGSRGYCAVAMTRGLPPFLAERLEELSGYKPMFAPEDPHNPVNWAHFRVSVSGKNYHVLSRVSAAGLDYSDRTNKFAHHVILSPEELAQAGPAWVLQQSRFMEKSWDQGEPRWLPAGRQAPQGQITPKICQAWTKATGDAGWAGVLAETAVADPPKPAVLLYEPGTDVLALLAEAIALLPPEHRWRATFSTYAGSLPGGDVALWRGYAIGSPEAQDARVRRNALVITLQQTSSPPPAGPFVDAARTGRTAAYVPPPEPKTLPPRTPAAAIKTDWPKQPAAYYPAIAEEEVSKVSLATLNPTRKTRAESTPVEGVAEGLFAASNRTPLGLGFFAGVLIAILLIGGLELATNGRLADAVGSKEKSDGKATAQDKEIGRLSAELEKQRGQLEKRTDELSLKQKELDKLKAEKDQSIGSLSRQLAKAKGDITALEAKIVGLVASANTEKITIDLTDRQPVQAKHKLKEDSTYELTLVKPFKKRLEQSDNSLSFPNDEGFIIKFEVERGILQIKWNAKNPKNHLPGPWVVEVREKDTEVLSHRYEVVFTKPAAVPSLPEPDEKDEILEIRVFSNSEPGTPFKHPHKLGAAAEKYRLELTSPKHDGLEAKSGNPLKVVRKDSQALVEFQLSKDLIYTTLKLTPDFFVKHHLLKDLLNEPWVLTVFNGETKIQTYRIQFIDEKKKTPPPDQLDLPQRQKTDSDSKVKEPPKEKS